MSNYVDPRALYLCSLIALTSLLFSCATTDDDGYGDPARMITVAEGVDVPLPDSYGAALMLLRSHDFRIQEYTSSSAVATKTFSPPIAVLRHPYQGENPHATVYAGELEIRLAAAAYGEASTVVFEQFVR